MWGGLHQSYGVFRVLISALSMQGALIEPKDTAPRMDPRAVEIYDQRQGRLTYVSWRLYEKSFNYYPITLGKIRLAFLHHVCETEFCVKVQ
jgi:hypothetical protein